MCFLLVGAITNNETSKYMRRRFFWTVTDGLTTSLENLTQSRTGTEEDLVRVLGNVPPRVVGS